MEAVNKHNDFALYRYLPIIILVEGFVSIATEILTIRQLLPVVGGSVVVTSFVIGIFLLFLALGYNAGGKQQTNLAMVLSRNFFAASIWLGIGLSYIFIASFFYFIHKKLALQIIYPLIAYLLIIIAPLIYLLGQTVPITMNMLKQNRSAGVIGGHILGISTIGSFLGSILTTLFFMYFFGVAWTIFFNFLLLIFLSLSLSQNKSSWLLRILLTPLCIWAVYSFNIGVEKSLFILTNSYANYQLYAGQKNNLNDGDKMLLINDSASSFLDKNNKGFAYIETIKKILFQEFKLTDADILVLGAGGFSLSAENTYNNRFTYVDIDNQIQKVTIPQFIPKSNSTIIIDDARHFLQSTKRQYHAIVVDTYSDIKTIPAHLLTQEYMLSIRARLRENGLVIFNIIGNPQLADAYSKHIDNTIRSVFANCMVIPISYTNRLTNILYTCSNKKNQMDKMVYLDNLNNSTLESFDWG